MGVQALHKQADTNHDGRISDHEILDIFQGVRNHLGASNFGAFLDLVNKLKGPINCSKNHDCGKCTDVKNAGLCGWFAESQHNYNNPFGGYQAKKSKGTCKFVDRSNSAEQNKDQYRLSTCATQCKNKYNKYRKPQQNGGRGNQKGGQKGGRFGNQNGGRGNFRNVNGNNKLAPRRVVAHRIHIFCLLLSNYPLCGWWSLDRDNDVGISLFVLCNWHSSIGSSIKFELIISALCLTLYRLTPEIRSLQLVFLEGDTNL